MVRTVNINQNVAIEDYYLLRAISDKIGFKKTVINEKEFKSEPTLQEIATFLVESGASFVSVEHNYRQYKDDELPFS